MNTELERLGCITIQKNPKSYVDVVVVVVVADVDPRTYQVV